MRQTLTALGRRRFSCRIFTVMFPFALRTAHVSDATLQFRADCHVPRSTVILVKRPDPRTHWFSQVGFTRSSRPRHLSGSRAAHTRLSKRHVWVSTGTSSFCAADILLLPVEKRISSVAPTCLSSILLSGILDRRTLTGDGSSYLVPYKELALHVRPLFLSHLLIPHSP